MQNTLKILVEHEIKTYLLKESGYSRLIRSLAGMEPKINSVGILTAENPNAKELSPKENRTRNLKLSRDLRELGYGFYQITGRYGNIEHPFVVPNVRARDLLALGKGYEQEAVIYVKKVEGSRSGMLASFITLNGRAPIATSRVVLPNVKNIEDFYSEYHGHKFVIPFFDEVFNDAELVDGKIVHRP
jgi:hypothetical protein